jgi:hypothetical protein
MPSRLKLSVRLLLGDFSGLGDFKTPFPLTPNRGEGSSIENVSAGITKRLPVASEAGDPSGEDSDMS